FFSSGIYKDGIKTWEQTKVFRMVTSIVTSATPSRVVLQQPSLPASRFNHDVQDKFALHFAGSKRRKDEPPQIVATLGPASSPPDILRQMIQAGATTLRFNFSHVNNESQRQWVADTVQEIQKLSRELGVPVSTFADLQGPKIRTGDLPNGRMELVDGETVFLTDEPNPTPSDKKEKVIPVTMPAIISAIREGQVIKLDDGKLRLKALESAVQSDGARQVRCVVEKGGTLTNRKGLNLPYVRIDVPALSAKDREDIRRAFSMGIQNIAVSFVQTVDDVKAAKDYIRTLIPEFGDLARNAKVIAKIEKPDAVEPKTLRAIVQEADMVMVARGDLGVEADILDLPKLEMRIIRECHIQKKPVIEATQLLESMMDSDTPSRPDVNDIADAARDGIQYLMLSGETSMGKYPVEAVRTMRAIAERYTEERSIPASFERLWDAVEVFFLRSGYSLKRLFNSQH
ncbi:MAG TPA: pyruvate kinase, partial [Oculatellaceae cyanobacterium]